MTQIKQISRNVGDSGTFGSRKTMDAIKRSQTAGHGLVEKKKIIANKLPSLTNSRPPTLNQYISKR